MPKAVSNKTPRKNSTQERLRATPFHSVEELDRETETIRKDVWKRFVEGQVIDELLSKPENKYLVEEWKAGLICFFGSDARNNIYKIFSDGRGLKLQLNHEFTKSLADKEVAFFEGVVRAGIEGYGALYLRSKSIIQNPDLQSTLAKIDHGSKKK